MWHSRPRLCVRLRSHALLQRPVTAPDSPDTAVGGCATRLLGYDPTAS
jgi:hypothetical protein